MMDVEFVTAPRCRGTYVRTYGSTAASHPRVCADNQSDKALGPKNQSSIGGFITRHCVTAMKEADLVSITSRDCPERTFQQFSHL